MKTLDPRNDNDWITHAEHEQRRERLTKWTNPTLWNLITQHGAPKPPPNAVWWNDWAANNPTPAAIALGKLDIVTPLKDTMKAIATGARPIEF
jgi:hypothetical protein